MKKIFSENRFLKMFVSLLIAVVFYGSCYEFYNIAWGTGITFGEFSLKWGFFFYSFTLFCIVLFLGVNFLIWQDGKFSFISKRLVVVRERIKFLSWPLAILTLILPIYIFQYTVWGVVFHGLYIRIMFWVAVLFIFASLTTSGDALIGWREFLAALVLTASGFSIIASLTNVTDYPFSQGWSEGNRLWDYSIIFGRRVYNYPADKGIPVLLDFGRQFIGGLPFLFHDVTIGIERFWVGLTLVFPYILLGIALFRKLAKEKKLWLITTLWTFLFLKQGPIHPPLVLSAVLVSMAWGSSLWFAIPIVIGAGYFAQASRFTWLFAPAIWIGMLEFSGASLVDGKLNKGTWIRTICLGLAGVFGGYILPKLLVLFGNNINFSTIGEKFASAGNNFQEITGYVALQPYLWYRLLPNPTYGNGILLGLLIAIAPLVIILFYLFLQKHWVLNIWQRFAIIFPLLAFLVVGLVASTKIGGGGDLHNMDMFLIGLLFTGAIAWYNGGRKWIQDSKSVSIWMKFVVALLIVIPGLAPLREMRSYSFGNDVAWLATLTDSPSEKSLGMLPPQNTIDSALEKIQEEAMLAQSQGGEVLFMDQRQLLTFGYITAVPFIPEYEKKVLMNEALSSNAKYFKPFYADLAKHRFALIVSEVLRTPIKDSSFQFGEENNAWVKWVANPILCYYDPKITLKDVGVQLLVPKTEQVDCTAQLP